MLLGGEEQGGGGEGAGQGERPEQLGRQEQGRRSGGRQLRPWNTGGEEEETSGWSRGWRGTRGL